MLIQMTAKQNSNMAVTDEPDSNHREVIVRRHAAHHPPHPKKLNPMLAQYVYPSKTGLFRIIRHGRQWRVLCEEQEIGRHETAEAALIATRMTCPQARLPGELEHWRYIPELALAHSRVSSEGTRWSLAG
jgi:hypothetical protein